MSKNSSAYGTPAGDTSFRKTRNPEEYAARAKERDESEAAERKARYEAKLAGKKYHKPMTGDEEFTSARSEMMDFSAQVGKTMLVPAGAGQGKRGRGAGFYCEACDLTFKDNIQMLEHINTPQHQIATGRNMNVQAATAEEVHERIEKLWRRQENRKKQTVFKLDERLELRKEEEEKEREEKRKKRHELAERKRAEKEAASQVKTEYGDDVRIEGEHEEDDMLTMMGIAGFGTSKQKRPMLAFAGCFTELSKHYLNAWPAPARDLYSFSTGSRTPSAQGGCACRHTLAAMSYNGASSSSQSTSAAALLLGRQLKQMQRDNNPRFSVGLVNDSNLFEWNVMLMIDDDVKFYGGANFRARLSFPPTYPHLPPSMTFQKPIPFHPNIYDNGVLCISILHPPEEDKYGYEAASERWSPVQTPETILLSVISLFSDLNVESPANVEAARLLREDPKEFRKIVRKCVRESTGEDS
ncbi:hypothetical protein PpBr36_00108 [Pyricularia pennisetigena]|uniref:hypothetical protein n=1 Tax=Pyricularia pennisetigena TaxID=1578925 RepID=UPI001154A186|nr:hypothetical protein PpBr36_00108 [Pyricularia pennisetigena]TLS29174.1 hypothetical protein PpBr36_00108 [Pyricularia pennisetigena]